MCYSAQIWADYRQYVKSYGATIDIDEFVKLFWHRTQGSKAKLPKGLELAFVDADANANAGPELQIRQAIDAFAVDEAIRLERELFMQRKRLADARRILQSRPTKAAAEHQRIAAEKIERALTRLADLRRRQPQGDDARIFPAMYAPVMVSEGGRRVVRPMRYQCRPAGKPALNDAKFPGTYNARRDNLEGFWRGQFGRTHGVMVVSAFYENVRRDGTNVVLEFRPQPAHEMLVACLWSRWSAPGEADLLSFAAITDEPPPEVAAAGHDRCIVPIKPEHLDAWLNPDPRDLATQYALLDDRDRPYYEHRLAA